MRRKKDTRKKNGESKEEREHEEKRERNNSTMQDLNCSFVIFVLQACITLFQSQIMVKKSTYLLCNFSYSMIIIVV